MVKFSKQLELQLVPEWKSAFCNYWRLKKDLKLIKFDDWRSPSIVETDAGMDAPKRALDASLLTRRRPVLSSQQNVITVQYNSCSGPQLEIYETEVQKPFSENEHEIAFFSSLDTELNKVNRFYGSREDEYTQRLEVLKKQLYKLTDLRKAFEDSQEISSSQSATALGTVLLKKSSGTTRRVSKDGIAKPRRVSDLNLVPKINSQLVSIANTICPEAAFDEEHEVGSSNDSRFSSFMNGSSPYSIELNIPKETPVLTISAIPRIFLSQAKKSNTNGYAREHELNISRQKLQYAKKMLRRAVVELYRGLRLLASFRSLNMLAFEKILKKYDKVTKRNASSIYFKVVERSRFYHSEKIDLMMDEVEILFAKHFAKDDRKKAMMLLKPEQQKACHKITYFLGLFSGVSLAFLIAFITLLNFNGARFNGPTSQQYGQSAYPIYSMLLLILLHMYMYGWNVYMWRQVRTNYPFIFEFAPKTELRHREILLVCTSLTTMVVASMMCHLMVYVSTASPFNPELIPLTTVLIFLLILFWPLNMFYRSSRFFFLKCMKRIILAPLYKVVLVDFFLADQLTSQIAALKYAEYAACYYLGGHFLSHDAEACGGPRYRQLAYVVSFLPYWWRLMQCMRRWADEGDRTHLANAGKYLSAMMAAGSRLTFSYNPSVGWMLILIVSSSLATVYQMYWDVVMDWGLLRRNSKNPWLRDVLILKNRSMYFVSIGLNCLLRLAWVRYLTHFQFRGQLNDFVFASLEVFRRGHWNFYRLENEHLNNVGAFRAVKTVPLPFRDDHVAD